MAASTDQQGTYWDAKLGKVPNKYKDEGDGTFAAVHESPTHTVAFDDDGAVPPNITHIGFAALGSLDTDPVWQIQKLTYAGGVRRILWADGDDNFDNRWDTHASTQVYS